jgi:ElaB/YqjD/DUF883 family membrane-anchored ribosome-binding protein
MAIVVRMEDGSSCVLELSEEQEKLLKEVTEIDPVEAKRIRDQQRKTLKQAALSIGISINWSVRRVKMIDNAKKQRV